MNTENQRIAEALRRAGYRESRQFVNDTDRLLQNLPARTRNHRVLKSASVAAALVLFLAFGMPWVVRAASAIISHLFSQRAQQIERHMALPEDEKFSQFVQSNLDCGQGHALDVSAAFMGVTIRLARIDLSPTDQFDASRKDGEARLWLMFSEIPAFDPNYMDFALRFDGNTYPMIIGDAQRYFMQDGHRATPEDWASWEGAGMARLDNGGVPTASVHFALPDWRIENKTDMMLTGSIDGQTFEIPFVYDPALARAEAEQSAREGMPLDQQYDERELQALQRAAGGAGQVGYVKRSGPIEFTISELSLSGNELFLSVAYKGGKETNPKLAAMTYFPWWIQIDGEKLDLERTLSQELKDGVFSAVYRAELEDASRLPEESAVYVKLYMGAKDGTGRDFGDTSDHENYGYAAFRYNWQTKTATLPEGEVQDAEWIAEAQRSDYHFDMPWTGKMMKHVDNGLDVSFLNVCVKDKNSIYIQPYVSAVRTWKHEIDRFEYTSKKLKDPVLTVNGHEMPFARVEYSEDRPFFLWFDMAGVEELNQGDRCELKMPVRIFDNGKVVFERVFTFRFKLGKRKA